MQVYCQLAEDMIDADLCSAEQSFDKECAGCRAPSRRCHACKEANGIADAKNCLCPRCAGPDKTADELSAEAQLTIESFAERLRKARLVKLPARIVVAQNAYRGNSVVVPDEDGDGEDGPNLSSIDAFAILYEHAKRHPRGVVVIKSPLAILEVRAGVAESCGKKMLANMERNGLVVWNRSEDLAAVVPELTPARSISEADLKAMAEQDLVVGRDKNEMIALVPKRADAKAFARKKISDDFAWREEEVEASQLPPVALPVLRQVPKPVPTPERTQKRPEVAKVKQSPKPAPASVPNAELADDRKDRIKRAAERLGLGRATAQAVPAPEPAPAPKPTVAATPAEPSEVVAKQKEKAAVKKRTSSKKKRLPRNYPRLRPEGTLLVRGKLYASIRACGFILDEDRTTLIMAFQFGVVRFFPALSQKSAITYAYSVDDLRRCCARLRKKRRTHAN